MVSQSALAKLSVWSALGCAYVCTLGRLVTVCTQVRVRTQESEISIAWLTPFTQGRGTGRPQCRPRANCDCAYLRPALPQYFTVYGPVVRGQDAHSVCQGLTMTAAPSYLQTVAHSLLVGQRGQAPAVLAPANCDGCAYLRPAHPHTHAASAPRSSGQAARIGCWTGA